MPTERSVAEVEELKALFTEASVLISTDYRGMNVTAMNLMRRVLRNSGVKYRISKNTLAMIAADEINRPEIKDLIVGPVGWVYSDSDASAAAKSLVDHIEAERLQLEIHGALMGDQMLSKEQVIALAKLPNRDQLLAMLFAQMNSPVAGLAIVLAGSIRGLATVLQRISETGEPETAVEEADSDEEAPAEEPEAAAAGDVADETPAAEPEAAAEDASADEDAPAAEPEAAAEEPEAAAEPEVAVEDAGADEEATGEESDPPAEEPFAEVDEGTEDKSEGEDDAKKD